MSLSGTKGRFCLVLSGLLVLSIGLFSGEAFAEWSVYVTNRGTGTVSVVDSASASVVETIPVGGYPRDVVISKSTGLAYVADHYNSIIVLDTETNQVVHTIANVWSPKGLALTPDESLLWVANNGYGALATIIDVSTNTIQSSIPMTAVQGTEVAMASDKVYVGTQENIVAVMDPKTGALDHTMSGAGYVTGSALTPDGGTLYTAGGVDSTLHVFDTKTSTEIASLPMWGWVSDVTVSPDGKRAYATTATSCLLFAVDTSSHTVVGMSSIPGRPIAMVVSPDSKTLFIVDDLGSSLKIVDAATLAVVASVSLGPTYWDPGTWAAPAGLAVLAVEKQVVIDIKPGSFPNSINPKSQGVIPVAILTTGSFNAALVDPATVLFGSTASKTPPVHWAFEDVDADLDLDLILHFSTPASDIQCGDTSAFLTAKTSTGQKLNGSDSIKTPACK